MAVHRGAIDPDHIALTRGLPRTGRRARERSRLEQAELVRTRERIEAAV